MWLSMILAAAMALQAGVSVLLHWEPPSQSRDAVVGYNVYRTDGASSTWVKINRKLVRSAQYKDKTVRPGQSYSYAIRSVDANGKESGPSSPWSVSIPEKSKQKVIEASQSEK